MCTVHTDLLDTCMCVLLYSGIQPLFTLSLIPRTVLFFKFIPVMHTSSLTSFISTTVHHCAQLLYFPLHKLS